jgi:hypothetical protein
MGMVSLYHRAVWHDKNMIQEVPNLAPDDVREALTQVLYQGLVFIRNFSMAGDVPSETKCEMLSDLSDALHNVPFVMGRYEEGHDAEYLIAHFFKSFDSKWGGFEFTPCLESIYRETLNELRKKK